MQMARDPYLSGGMGSSIDPSRPRVCKVSYWTIRLSSHSMRLHLMFVWKGDRQSRTFQQLWMCCEVIDLEVAEAYKYGGVLGINARLDSSDTLEHCMTTVVATLDFMIHKDPRVYREMLSARVPGASYIAPTWFTTQAFDRAKASFQADNRLAYDQQRGSGAAPQLDDTDINGILEDGGVDMEGIRKRPRRPRPKPPKVPPKAPKAPA